MEYGCQSTNLAVTCFSYTHCSFPFSRILHLPPRFISLSNYILYIKQSSSPISSPPLYVIGTKSNRPHRTRPNITCTHKKQNRATTTATSLNLIMTEAEISAILSKANGCVESECAVSDVDDLISELKDQQRVLSARLESIMNAVAHLQAANAAGEKRKADDVRSIVKDMLRVFTTVVSGGVSSSLFFPTARLVRAPPDPLV